MVLAGPKFAAMAALAMTTSRWVMPWEAARLLTARLVEVVDEQSSSWTMRLDVGCVGRELRVGAAVEGVRTHAITML
jgi:hypothetical protein